MAGTSLLDVGKNTLSGITGGGKLVMSAAEKGRGYIGIAALALAGLSTLSLAKAFSPEAVADNSTEFLLNETLKTSLAKARQDNEVLKREKKRGELARKKALPHDRFV